MHIIYFYKYTYNQSISVYLIKEIIKRLFSTNAIQIIIFRMLYHLFKYTTNWFIVAREKTRLLTFLRIQDSTISKR